MTLFFLYIYIYIFLLSDFIDHIKSRKSGEEGGGGDFEQELGKKY